MQRGYNVFVERLWRAVKYTDLSIRGYGGIPELRCFLAAYEGLGAGPPCRRVG